MEYACYCGNYYGTPREYVEKKLEEGKDVILEIEIQGALKIKGYFLVEPRTFDHAGLFVFLVAHGPLHHIAHTVDEPYPTDTTAF